MNASERILSRARALLALSSSPNEHEAALAAERLQGLLVRHSLSHADLAIQTLAKTEGEAVSGYLGSAHPDLKTVRHRHACSDYDGYRQGAAAANGISIDPQLSGHRSLPGSCR